MEAALAGRPQMGEMMAAGGGGGSMMSYWRWSRLRNELCIKHAP